MRAEDLTVNGDYAYIDPTFPNDVLRATVLSEPDDGVVSVHVQHPDLGPCAEQVPAEALLGAWDANWEAQALDRVSAVRRQRALADRLRSLTGIERKHQHYAGRGGASVNKHDALLQLNHDELEELLSRAENGPAYTPRPTTPAPRSAPEIESVS